MNKEDKLELIISGSMMKRYKYDESKSKLSPYKQKKRGFLKRIAHFLSGHNVPESRRELAVLLSE